MGYWATDKAGAIGDAYLDGYATGLADALLAAAGCASADQEIEPVTDAQLQAMSALLEVWTRRHMPRR